MDYKAFTNGSLSLMYEAVRAALGSDDAQERQGEETFQLSLPFLTTIDRQIASAQKQLMAFLKEIDRRESRRAHAFRRTALNAISHARSPVADKGQTS